MNTILEISNWNQLVRAKSEEYPNLSIDVVQYNSAELTGTKVCVLDMAKGETYFAAFVVDLESTVIPTTATLSDDAVITAINNFGFNVRISRPILLTENVITILRGLYVSGYNYVYRDYIPCIPISANETWICATEELEHRYNNKPVSNIPNFRADEWEWCEFSVMYPINDLITTGTVNNGIPI